MAALAAGVALCCAAAVPAGAAPSGRMMFAAGEQFVGVPTGSFEHTDASYWSERRDRRAYTPSVLRLLHRNGASLDLHLRYQRDFGPVPPGRPRYRDALPILRAAAKYGVPVRAWLVVPYADGYWADEHNVAEVAAAARSFTAWARAGKFRFAGVLLDLESSLQDTRTFAKLRSDPGPVMDALRRNASPRSQCAAAGAYDGVVAQLRGSGFHVMAAAYPFVLDDIANGDVALQDGLDAPLLLPGRYDNVGFMTMRTVMADLAGADPGPSLLASYQDAIAAFLPHQGSLGLGVAGLGAYRSLATLVYDVRAAAMFSTRPLGLYSLDAAYLAYGLPGLRAILAAARAPLSTADARAAAEPSDGTRRLRSLLAGEDALVGAGTPAAAVSRGEAPVAPNRYPAPC
jgi:hypothetical protein